MNTYQMQAARTRIERPIHENLTHSAMGIAGEVGELVNKLKKIIYHKHALNDAEMIEELGDCLWYLADIATTLGYNLDDIAKHNIAKLKRRYPNGFDVQRSINRDDGPASMNEVVNEHVVYVPPAEYVSYPERPESLYLDDYHGYKPE